MNLERESINRKKKSIGNEERERNWGRESCEFIKMEKREREKRVMKFIFLFLFFLFWSIINNYIKTNIFLFYFFIFLYVLFNFF